MHTEPARWRADAPKYLQLARGFERQLRAGVLRIGDRLPSVRQLQEQHKVSAATAVGCYEWLERQGYVRARPKSGFYVSRTPVADGPDPVIATAIRGPLPIRLGSVSRGAATMSVTEEMIDLGPAILSAELLPQARLNRSLRLALSAFDDNAVRHEDACGNLRLRRQIARLTFRSGAACSPDDVIVTAGGTEALTLCLRAVTSPGDLVAVESPGCYEVLQGLEAFRLRAVEIPHVRGKAIDRAALAAALDRHPIKALLIEASCNNALGDCADDEEKAAIVALATKHDLPVIEGDVFGDLVFSGARPRPLKAFDRSGIVMQCCSLAHHVAPGFNIGWANPGRWHDPVARLKGHFNAGGSRLPQLALAEFLESGAFDKHMKHMRVILEQLLARCREEVLREFPSGTRVSRPDGGFVLWVQLPDRFDGDELQRRALDAGVRILSGSAFAASGQYRHCIRISCGYPFERMQPAIRLLASLLER